MIIDSLKSLAVPIDKLQGLPNNPRLGDVNAVMASLARFGQRKPIVARYDDGTIIAGNHTWQAAKQLGWTEIAVAYVGDDDVTAQAYALADNRTAELGSYDEQALKDLIEQVHAVVPEFVRDAGWSDEAVKELVAKIESEQIPEVTQTDYIPEPPEEPKAKLGNIWQLGNHRLMCGDSTDDASVNRLMNNEKADMVFTDPPYALFGNSTGVAGITDDNMVRSFFRDIFVMLKKYSKTNAHIYVCCDWHSAFSIQNVSKSVELAAKNLCIWDKGDGGVGGMYQNCYEMIWFFTNAIPQTKTHGITQNVRTVNGKPNIWRVGRETNDRVHNAQKPIDLIDIPINASSDKNEIVLDLFGGSGSTLIAAEKNQRIAYLMELEPKWCDVIIERWEKSTGQKAVLTNAESA